MTVVLHTNSGFVTTAPTADPAGSADVVSDGSALVTKDTAPTGAVLITEVGWYKSVGTTSSNTQVGLYAADGATVPGEAGTRLQVTGDAASGTSAGWIRFTGLSWVITPNTVYWLGMQQDAHAGSSDIDSATSGGSGINVRTNQTALPNPFGGGALSDTDGMYAIYAVYNTAPTVALNSPADTATGVSTTPVLDFTGTDAEANDVRYEVQVDTASNFHVSTPARVQSAVNQGQVDGSKQLTVAITTQNCTAGNLLILAVNSNSASATEIATVTDPNNTWHRASGSTEASFSSTELWYAYNIAGGVKPTVTVTITQASLHLALVLAEYSGVKSASDPFDKQIGASTTSSTNPFSSGNTPILSESDELVIGVMGENSGSDTPTNCDTGYANILYEVNATDGETVAIADKVVSSITAQSASWTWSGTGAHANALCITFKSLATPLLDKISGTDAGFANPDTGGDTDPFNSGENIQYTVQSALANSTVYYWRVRGLDPTGSNTYGAWATTRSFTTGGTAALTGTATASITEADIVAGGKTIILTLTGDTWIAAGAASFDLQRANIIAGLTSAQSEATGWNNVVKVLQAVTGVVRTSDTVVTITLDAQATYNITATETITATIPATALTGNSAIVASPTFTISAVGGTTVRKLAALGVG